MLPVIATLQQQWPETKITWIIGKVEYQLVKSLANIEFIVFDKKTDGQNTWTLEKNYQ